MTGYIEATVIVAGALDERQEFTDTADFESWLERVKYFATDNVEPVEVYVIEHDHEPADCECVQFLTDHYPAWENAASKGLE